MYFVEKNHNNLPCKAYFFKRWGTYEHPVTPLESIEYKEALTRKGYCRAWMCTQGGGDLFVFFEAMQNTIDKTNILKPRGRNNEIIFYEKTDSGDKGLEISAEDTLDKKYFYVALPDTNGDYLSLITSKNAYNFQYSYSQNKELERVVVTNIEGEERIIDYK